MNKSPKVSIVILTWNGLKLVLELLKDINKLETKGLNTETIVVDNGSTDGTQEKLRGYKLQNMPFKLIRNKENLGFAEGNNVGMREATKRGADYVLLLNNDVILPKNLLVQLIKVAEDDKKIGLLAPKMYFAKGYEFHKERYSNKDLGKVIWYAGGMIDWDNIYSSHKGVDEVDKGQYDKQEETDIVNGACALIRKEVIEDIGYLDKKIFLYWEDADYSQRARKKGWKIVYTPKTHLWHKVAQASGIGSGLNDYFLTRNRMIFGMRYARLRTKLALIRESFKLLVSGRKWQKIGTRDFYLRRFGKGSWGKE
jgi:GT2 family glycosyltransferase